MRYVVVADGKVVVYCGSRAEALHVAQERKGRAYRADWTEITEQ